jgi:hypothetical protein
MASVIVGPQQPVRVSTSQASRRALARVGKRAATTGDTIHLDHTRPAPEVIAHELTHVAHRSPAPRFFADDHRGPEERQAEKVAAVMRRSPILPGVRSLGSTTSVQRAPASTTTTTTTTSAAALADSITRPRPTPIGTAHATATPTAPETIQRTSIQRLATTTAPAAATTQSTTDSTSRAAAPTTSETLDQFEHILELLEDRIMSELERRGGRFRGGF